MHNMEYANMCSTAMHSLYVAGSSEEVVAHIETAYTVACLLPRWLYSEPMPIVCSSFDAPMRRGADVGQLVEGGVMYAHQR